MRTSEPFPANGISGGNAKGSWIVFVGLGRAAVVLADQCDDCRRYCVARPVDAEASGQREPNGGNYGHGREGMAGAPAPGPGYLCFLHHDHSFPSGWSA
jgi:hypothetical protein